jgi:hypothetical protein
VAIYGRAARLPLPPAPPQSAKQLLAERAGVDGSRVGPVGMVSSVAMTMTQQSTPGEFPRPLSQGERELLEFVIQNFVKSSELMSQIRQLVVVGKCGCGCPTIDLWKPGQKPPPAKDSRVFWHGYGTVANGEPATLLLFQNENVISCLEVAPLGDERNCGLPQLDSIQESRIYSPS